jgi:hypothetical protein
MDDRDCLALYPFVVVRIACRICSRGGSYRLARLAVKFGPEITLRDLLERFPTTACGGLRREASADKAPVAFICRTLNKRVLLTSREGWAKLYVPLSTEIIAQCWRPISQSAALQGRRSQPRPKDFS